MKRFLSSSLVFVALIAFSGCSTNRHPKAVEYKKVVHFGRSGNIEPVLNELGKEGWRVVGYQVFTGDENVVLLERKIRR